MSAATSLAYTYRYPFASDVGAEGSGFGLRLATSGGAEANPYFFHGRLAYPKEIADQLLALAQVVSSRFYLPNFHLLLDPVVTANDQVLRFEGFSSCCGVYARADFGANAFEADLHRRGTTNVDFNTSMRTALARIRQSDKVSLGVGAEGVALTQGSGEVVEKKVKLPVRWIKGFTEVQAYQAGLKPRLEVSGGELRQFLSGLPRGVGPREPSYVTASGRGLRLSQRPSAGAVQVMGTERLRLLEPLAGTAKSLRLWADDEAGVSAWELTFSSGRFVLMVSPEVSRGFSGEGQMLQRLASKEWEEALPRVQGELAWQARIRVDAVAERTGLSAAAVEGALGVLGARGLVGYDLAERAYFHRELPFDLGKVESLQPRLKEARRLVREQKVRITERHGEGESFSAIVMVQGTDVEHRVRLLSEGDRCTCPWFSKNQGERGACKHVLAARMAVEAPGTPEIPPEPLSEVRRDNLRGTGVTNEELEHLVAQGNATALAAALAPLDEAQRRKLAKCASGLLRQARDDERASVMQILASMTGQIGVRKPITDAQKSTLAAIEVAVLGLCSWTEAKRVRPNWWFWDQEKVRAARLDVLRARRPEWIDRWVEQELEARSCDWLFVRTLVREGVCRRPTSEAYIWRMDLSSLSRHREMDNDIVAGLRRDEGLLEDELWQLFEAAPGQYTRLSASDFDTDHPGSWGHALLKLSASGEIDRQRLLTASVRTLDRPLQAHHTGWFCRLHEELKPTAAERRERLPLYVALLVCAVPAVVGFALDALKALDREGELDVETTAEAIRPAFALKEKGHALKAVQLLTQMARHATDEPARSALALTATCGLAHRSSEVQSACLDLIEAHGAAAGAALSAALEAQAESVAPSQRVRVKEILGRVRGDTETPQPARANELAVLEREAAPLPAKWRALAGVDAVLAAWRSGGELPALDYDPMNAPRLDEAARLKPIESLDELIDGLSTAVEGLDDADQLERLLDGLSRLGDRRPIDFKARTGSLLNRANTNDPSMWPGSRQLRQLARAWLEGKGIPHGPVGHVIEHASSLDFMGGRMAALTQRLLRGETGPLLAFPTHRGGWLDPRVLVERMMQWREMDAENSPTTAIREPGFGADWFDLVQAMLRLAPDHRAEALQAAGNLQGEAGRAVRFALGGQWEWGMDACLKAAALRAREPFAAHSLMCFEWSRAGDYPVAKRYDALGWAVRQRDFPYAGDMGVLVYACQKTPPEGSLPPDAQTRPLLAFDTFAGCRDARTIRGEAAMWPLNPELALAYGAAAISARLNSQPSTFSPTAPYLEPLFDQDTRLTPMARLALALGVVSREAGCRGLAIDALIALIQDGRCVGVELGSLYAELCATPGFLPLNRVARALSEVARVSALHQHVAMQTLEAFLAELSPSLPADLHHVLTPLHEWLLAGGEVLGQAAQTTLRGVTGEGKTGKLAKTLLGLRTPDVGARRDEVYGAALKGRMERAGRWAGREATSSV